MRFSFVFAVLCFLVMQVQPAWALGEADIIGTVMEVEGGVVVTSARGAVQATVDTPVHQNDKIATGAGARALVLFIDNTELTLSENTELTVDEYIFDPDDNANNKSRYSILRGAFYYVSGLIAKKENPDVRVNTPYGSIGIRGTEFWGGDIDDDYGVLVADGAVDVTTKQGKIGIDKGYGSALKSGRAEAMKPKLWPTEKVERAKKTILLKRQAMVRERIKQFGERQGVLRAKHKEIMKRRIERMRDRLPPEQRQGIQDRPMLRDKMRMQGERLLEREPRRPAPQRPMQRQDSYGK